MIIVQDIDIIQSILIYSYFGQNKYSIFRNKPDVVLIFGASNNMKTRI